MAEPVFPNGYSRLQKVYSGNVAGKPRGMLPNETDAEAFFLVHNIERNANVLGNADYQAPTGFWTVQICSKPEPAEDEEDPEEPVILFEQSVMMRAIGVSGFGGLITTWFPSQEYVGRFKTRICDGVHVPPVVPPHTAGHVKPLEPEAPKPGIPGVVMPFNVRVTSLSLRMPVLPARAESLALYVGANRYGGYQELAGGLTGGEEVFVTAGELESLLGIELSVENNAVTTFDPIWFRVRAINESGFSDGEAVQDSWNRIRSSRPPAGQSWLQSGYEAYKHLDLSRASEYSEQYYTLNEAAGSGFFSIRYGGDIVMPPYKCRIPPGHYLRIISDYWVGPGAKNEIHYSLSYRPREGAGADAVWDEATGTLWSFLSRNGLMLCGRTTRPETYFPDVDAGRYAIAGQQTPALLKGFRYGATLVAIAATFNDIFAARSLDEGRTWEAATKEGNAVIEGIRALAVVREKNGTILIYGAVNPGNGKDGQYAAGDAVCVVLKESQEGIGVQGVNRINGTDEASSVFPTSNIVGLVETGGGLLLVATENANTVVYRSQDRLGTLVRVPATQQLGAN